MIFDDAKAACGQICIVDVPADTGGYRYNSTDDILDEDWNAYDEAESPLVLSFGKTDSVFRLTIDGEISIAPVKVCAKVVKEEWIVVFIAIWRARGQVLTPISCLQAVNPRRQVVRLDRNPSIYEIIVKNNHRWIINRVNRYPILLILKLCLNNWMLSFLIQDILIYPSLGINVT